MSYNITISNHISRQIIGISAGTSKYFKYFNTYNYYTYTIINYYSLPFNLSKWDN